jgi:signal transduction histidine kinase
MGDGNSADVCVYVLPIPDVPAPCSQASWAEAGNLPEALLVGNALWFCRLRWLVVAALLGFGLAGGSPRLMAELGLRTPGNWPLLAAGVLTLSNAVFLAHVRFLKGPTTGRRSVLRNLWGQIAMDLLVLSAVVHFVGSTQTYVAFAYLFHIVLASVFLSRTRSLLVTAAAMALYGSCVLAERMELIASRSIFAGPPLPQPSDSGTGVAMLNCLSAMGIWLVVWHLTSRLSRSVRLRDIELARTNCRLLAAQEDRARYMLTTTHQLKAPFAAIHANAQVLLEGYCGQLPDAAVPIVQRILARCRRLASEIQEMLQLANLRSTGGKDPQRVPLDLAELMRWSLAQVEPIAQGAGVTLQYDLEPTPTVGVEDHLKMLLVNVVHNAVTYSHRGGQVRVACRTGPDGQAHITVADDGIGIPADKLPRIFDEHYRTNEAVRHNKDSSGLGLAIVRDVAKLHRVQVAVKSSPMLGTTFDLHFPPPTETGEAGVQ